MSDKDLPREDQVAFGRDRGAAGGEASGARLERDGEGVGVEERSGVAGLEEAFFDEDKVAAIRADLEAGGASVGPGSELGEVGDLLEGDDALEGEDELARIMAPARSVRHPIVAAVVIVASLAGLYWLYPDFRFFLRSSEPRQVGRASAALKAGRLVPNTYVTLSGQVIPQTMANGVERSLFGAAATHKVYMFILRDTDNRLVVRTRRPLVTNMSKPGPHKFRAGVFTGRLRRLDDTGYAAELRGFYVKQSERSKVLRQEHELTAAAILRAAGKPGPTLQDVSGARVTLRQQTPLTLFVSFPGEYELQLHTEMRDTIKKMLVKGGKGASKCGDPDPKTGLPPTGRGGSVYVQPDPKVLTLDGVAEKLSVAARDARPPAGAGEQATDGQDLVIPVPPGTEVFNATSRDCTRACANLAGLARKRCGRSCSPDSGVQISPDPSGRVLVAVGGRCGGFPGEAHKIDLRARIFDTAKRAEAFVAALGYPYALAEDASKTSRKTVTFVVRMPREAALRLQRRQTRSSVYNISPRFEVILVRWRHLERQGRDLLITRTSRGFPTSYRVQVTKAGKRLVAEPLGATLTVPSSRLRKAQLSMVLRLPPDTLVLEEGVSPSSMWSEPFLPGVPIFYAMLIGIILLNLLAIVAHFRG